MARSGRDRFFDVTRRLSPQRLVTINVASGHPESPRNQSRERHNGALYANGHCFGELMKFVCSASVARMWQKYGQYADGGR